MEKFRLRLLMLYFATVFFSMNIIGVCGKGPQPGDLDAANWMKNHMNKLGKRTLKQICIPGSHNAGMSSLTGGTAFVSTCNVITQSLPMKGQLLHGARYFDVRPVLSGGKFFTGHYHRVPGGVWQGGNGQSMEQIVNDINSFTKYHNELVIVSLSHTINTDFGPTMYRTFNQEDWNRLFSLLGKTENLFYAPSNVYLPSVTLGDFTKNGTKAAVLYVIEHYSNRVSLGERWGRGFFLLNNIQFYNEYTNTNTFNTMADDQFKKMRDMSRKKYFVLSWTLSQSPKDAAMCLMNARQSIKNLARKANEKLKEILDKVSVQAFPNIIFIDDINSSEVTKISVAINNKLNF